MDTTSEVEIPGSCQVEEHARSWLAATTPFSGRVRAEPPVGQGAAQLSIEPPEAVEYLSLRDFPAADSPLVADDEAGVELGAHLGESLANVRHDDGATFSVEDRTVVPGQDERPAPIEKQGPGAHEADGSTGQ